MIFPISKAKYNLIKAIYENPNIKISELLKKTGISQLVGYKYINELLDAEIISEKLEGKKPTLRLLRPKFSEAGKACFTLVEEEKKLNFFIRHRELKGPFIHFRSEVKKFVNTVLIFGSFARGAETKNSDIDILIISSFKNKKKIEKAVEKCFVTLKRKVSIRLITKAQFIRAIEREEGFAMQVLKEHIVILNAYNWIDLIAKVNYQ